MNRPENSARDGVPWTAGRQLSLLARSFFIQASWNYERMQGVGLAASLAGEGRRLYRQTGEAVAFLKRHTAYFNTNPVLASFLIGAVVRLEDDVAGGRAAPADVDRFKRGLAGPLAAWGDTLFFTSVRPAATAAGALVALTAGGWGVLTYLLAYNTFHLYYRFTGLSAGYRLGRDVVKRLGDSSVRTLPGPLRRLGVGATAAAAVLASPATVGTVGALSAVVWLLAGLAFFALRRRSGLGAGWGLLAIAAGLAQAWIQGGR